MLLYPIRLVALSIAMCASISLLAQVDPSSAALQPRVLTPAEFLTSESFGDNGRIALPGQVSTRSSAEQDSAYASALRLRIPSSIRFATALMESSAAMRFRAEVQRAPSIWEQINTTMNIPREIMQPSAQERTQYQLTIANAMYVPGVLLYPMGTGNAQINFNDIAKIFGFGEDVSPVIRYVVDETIEVEILLYSTQAIIVRTLYHGIQAPGTYSITWDGREQNGKQVTDGEYIAEVRLGDERMMRKRISWKGTR
ncbi:MAG: hypothetical protein NTX15_00760 [Candidatus Kapabacteria bacterium]|nr:hypothetical protein [Candidatus Kapabacteria bacterium]